MSLYKYPLKPGTNWEILLRKDICHIYICLTNVSVCHIVFISASANGERVFDQFLNLVGNIFASREATLVFAKKLMFPDMGDRKTFETNHEYFRDNVPYVWSRL